MTAARVVARVQQQAPSARDAFEVQRKEALAEHAKQLHQLQQERARQQEQQQQQAHKQELARKQVKEQQQQSAVSPAAAAPPSTPAAANATASASGATQPPPATPAAVASPANSSTAAGAADPFAGMGLEEVKKKGADMFQAREWEGAKVREQGNCAGVTYVDEVRKEGADVFSKQLGRQYMCWLTWASAKVCGRAGVNFAPLKQEAPVLKKHSAKGEWRCGEAAPEVQG
eukprot:1159393-Pelagomonas_calceolata.AAC.1